MRQEIGAYLPDSVQAHLRNIEARRPMDYLQTLDANFQNLPADLGRAISERMVTKMSTRDNR